MRMSLTRICGPSASVATSSAANTSRGLVKLRVGRPSRSKAFSSTNRMDWSSSTIQIGFIFDYPFDAFSSLRAGAA